MNNAPSTSPRTVRQTLALALLLGAGALVCPAQQQLNPAQRQLNPAQQPPYPATQAIRAQQPAPDPQIPAPQPAPEPQTPAQQLSLHEAIQRAMNAPQTQAAVARTDEARGQLRQAGLGINPRLYLQSEDWRPWGSDFDFPTQTEDYAFLTQTFELDGKRRKRVSVAGARVGQAEAQEQMTRFSIAGQVAAAYWNASSLERTVTLLQEDMRAVDEMVRYHRERVDAGAMRGVDLLRMQIERDRLELALRLAERDASQARLELFKQMGTPPMRDVRLSDSMEAALTAEPVSVETALAQRPDLREARQAVAVAEADVTLQKANGVPDLDLTGGYKRNAATNTGYSSLLIPLPFRNRNQGEIARAEASVRLARSSLQALDLRVRAEIAESQENYQRQRQIVTELLPDMRAKAKQNLQLMTEAYRIGGVDLLRYLDAERTEFDVEVNALRTLADYQQASLRLQLSNGVQP